MAPSSSSCERANAGFGALKKIAADVASTRPNARIHVLIFTAAHLASGWMRTAKRIAANEWSRYRRICWHLMLCLPSFQSAGLCYIENSNSFPDFDEQTQNLHRRISQHRASRLGLHGRAA